MAIVSAESQENQRDKAIIVALDGPAGAGKSTIAKRVAERLGFVLLDTGALYRSVALAAKQAGLTFDDTTQVAALTFQLIDQNRLAIDAYGSTMTVLLDGVDVADHIRTPEISRGASVVSSQPAVRESLLDVQRNYVVRGASAGVVCEGRDIGTVVFPNAAVKIFVTASVEARAGRRHLELRERGVSPLPTLEETYEDVRLRDDLDEQRAIAPLKRAPDALLLDTTELSLDQAVEEVVSRVRQAQGRSAQRAGVHG